MYQSSIVPHLNLAKSYCQGILCSPALTNNSVTIKYTKQLTDLEVSTKYFSRACYYKTLQHLDTIFHLRLPSKLVLEWPENDKLEPNSKIPAGTTIGMNIVLITE